jgi:predicted PurR-regulated permease PerM
MRTDSGYIRSINSFFVAIVTIIVLIGLWQIRAILMLAVASMMLTVLAAMPVHFFMKRGLNRGLAILLSLTSGILIVVLMILLVFPTLFIQFSVLFTDTIPNGINQLIEFWNSGEIAEQAPFLAEALKNVDLSAMVIDADLINQAFNQASAALGTLGGSVLPLIGGVASAVLSVLIIFFLCLYLLAEPDRYINGVIKLTPLWYGDRIRFILARVDTTTRAWLRVTGASMVIVGLGTGLGLALLGIEQWMALGVLAGVFSFIPNFGTIAALVPSVAVAIVQAPESSLLVILIIFGVSFVQAQIVGPILTADSMNLPPVLVLVGQIVFGVFFGFLGLMLSVPLTAILVVVVEEVYVKDFLGDTREGLHVVEGSLLLAESD